MKHIGIGLVLASMCAVSHGQVDFSHELFSSGAPGSAVNASPDQSGLFNGGLGTNVSVAITNDFGLVLGDNIDAFDSGQYRSSPNGISRYPFLFSVDNSAMGQPGTPIRAQFPMNGADVYGLESGVVGHLLAYNETDMGMLTSPDESIDAIDNPLGLFGARVYFSLESGSPTLLANGWSGADVLSVVMGVPGTITRTIRARDLGLIPADDLDGLAMFGLEDGGDGVVDPADPAEGGLIYFTVSQLSVGESGSEIRQRSLTPGRVGGDIYMSGTAGSHLLLYPGDTGLKLFQGDTIDALKLGSGDPLDPFPMIGFGSIGPEDIPEKPVNCPPYRGGGIPIGCFWVEVCDTVIPANVNWEIVVKLCDADGNVIEIVHGGESKGVARNAESKAKLIKDAFESMTFTKPGPPPKTINLFKKTAKSVPPRNIVGNRIVGEVCMVVNQELIDCGWNIDRVCFSFTNWTANIIATPVKNWFPDVKRFPLLAVEGIAENDGLLRISFIDTIGAEGVESSFAVPVFAGQDGLSALFELEDLINSKGGVAVVGDDGVMTIKSLPLEPPLDEDGVSGPVVFEAGALDVFGLNITVGANLARGPGSPCSAVDYAKPYGELNFFDVSAFLQRFADQVGDADLAFDGSFNFFDISTFLQLYAQGCPE